MSSSMTGAQGGKTFHIVLIRASHYDDDGYVIQWHRSIIPSNTLAILYGLCRDLAERRILGDDVHIAVTAMDEANTRIPLGKIIRQISASGAGGLVAFAGVQTNQFPRAMDMAAALRRAGIHVCIGGFHVSGCLAMLPDLPAELQQALGLGVSLFAGEAEDRLEQVVRDAYHGQMQPIYNQLATLPDLESKPTPFLPANVLQRAYGSLTSFDAGRGCPFLCSFCTIINVQGHKSRTRSADAVEHIIRENAAQGIWRYLITDDNFARNRAWEEILDRIILLRKRDNLAVRLLLQVDTMCHRIPGFIDKAAEAGTAAVFVGLESLNKDILAAAGKRHNKISEYRKTLQAWQQAKVITSVGYIVGFPGDTVASIIDDIDLLQRELPVGFLQPSYLTPLPGSEDHKKLHTAGVWMEPDLNKYDLNHITTRHPTMTDKEWKQAYNAVMDHFYSDEQVEIRLKRARAYGIGVDRFMGLTMWYIACRLEGVQAPEGGLFRHKYRLDRRPGLPIESPFIFYPRRVWEVLRIYTKLAIKFLKFRRICRNIKADPNAARYSDASLSPLIE
jgi:radical SAM superfamily enzyme YgiQ (UPF0313 family)